MFWILNSGCVSSSLTSHLQIASSWQCLCFVLSFAKNLRKEWDALCKVVSSLLACERWNPCCTLFSWETESDILWSKLAFSNDWLFINQLPCFCLLEWFQFPNMILSKPWCQDWILALPNGREVHQLSAPCYSFFMAKNYLGVEIFHHMQLNYFTLASECGVGVYQLWEKMQ